MTCDPALWQHGHIHSVYNLRRKNLTFMWPCLVINFL